MIDLVEEAAYVGFDYVVDALLLEGFAERGQTSMLAVLWAIAIAAVFEVLFVNRFQYVLYRQFDQLVFKTADAQRSTFFASRFRVAGHLI